MATANTGARGATDISTTANQLAVGQRRSQRRESLLGLLFVAPATILMLVFGLFPVLYGFLISMQGGTILPQGFVGLDQYYKALGSLAYLLMLAIALSLIIGDYFLYRAVSKEMRAGKGNSYRYAAYSVGIAAILLTAIILIGFTFREIAQQVAPIYAILSNTVSGTAKVIVPLEPQFIALPGIVAGAAIFVFAGILRQRIDAVHEPGKASLLSLIRWVMFAVTSLLLLFEIAALELLRGTLAAFGRVTPEKLAEFTTLKPAAVVEQAYIWPDVVTLLLGMALIAWAGWLWIRAAKRETSVGMLLTFGCAILFMVGGWLFIGELPHAAATGDEAFYQSLLRTATYAVLTVPLQLLLGLLLAYLLFNEVKWGKAGFRIIYFLPYVAPTIATAAVFAMIFSIRPQSPANQFLTVFGLPPQEWLRDPKGVFELIARGIAHKDVQQLPPFLVGPSLPLLSAVLYSVWVFSGYNAVIFLAGLAAVPREMYEAAQVDGAGRWSHFRYITLPLISPTTFFLTILSIVGTFKAFNHLYVLRRTDSRGALDVATVYIFDIIRERGHRPYAAATSFVLFGIILILTLIQNRLSRDQVFYG